MLGCRKFPRQSRKTQKIWLSKRKIEKRVSCKDQTRKPGGWKGGSAPNELGSEVWDRRKCHVPAREEQGQCTLTRVEAHGAAAIRGASADG